MNIQSLLFPFMFLLCSCSDVEPEAVNDRPVARAGAAYITQGDIEYHLGRFDTDARMAIIDNEQQYRQLIESVALTRIMAQKQEASMTIEQRYSMDLAVRAYRDQMLAKSYIEENVQRQVPDRKAVEEYYQAHAEEFGKRKQYSILELRVQDSCVLAGQMLEPVLTKSHFSELQKSDCQLEMVERRFEEDDLFRSYPALTQLPVVEHGYWTKVDGVSVLIFVVSAMELPARPLSEVVSEIRRKLAPEYLKRSLEAERKQLNREIEFLD